jgi:hypothetical protein
LPRNSRLRAEEGARTALASAIADYRHDWVLDRAAADHVLAALRELTMRIPQHRSDPEAMKIARSFARLVDHLAKHVGSPWDVPPDRWRRRLVQRLVELLVSCVEIARRPGEIERKVDITPLVEDIRNPRQWRDHRELFAAYRKERMLAILAHVNRHGPRDALATFIRALTYAGGHFRPGLADVGRIAGLIGLVPPGRRVRHVRLRQVNFVIGRPRRKAVSRGVGRR